MKLTPLPITAVPSPLHSPMPVIQTNMHSLPLSRLPLSLPAWSANLTLVRSLSRPLSAATSRMMLPRSPRSERDHTNCSFGYASFRSAAAALRFVRLKHIYKTGRQMAKPVSRPTELHAQATTSNVSCSRKLN